jgi:hypothetical protein
MRNILLAVIAIATASVLTSCSTTVRTDDGHAVTTGVHAR